MADQPTPKQQAQCDLLQSSNPRIHAQILDDEMDTLNLGIATLYVLAPEGSEERVDQHAVLFVVKSLEHISHTMYQHLRALRRTLGMPEVRP